MKTFLPSLDKSALVTNLEIESREKGSEVVEHVWTAYQKATQSLGLALDWFYSQARAKQTDVDCSKEETFPASENDDAFTFTSVSIYKHRRLARVPDAQDYIYQAIRARIQKSLLFKAISDRDIELISTILYSKPPPPSTIKNKRGETPLHIAALLDPPSEDIVTLLINERPHDTLETDNDGQIPLHCAVWSAWNHEPEEGLVRSEYSAVIRYLMRNMQRVDLDFRDFNNMSPWDAMCDNEEGCVCRDAQCAAPWIRELKENLEPISGPAVTREEEHPTAPEAPEEASAQYRACFNSLGTVGEFYHLQRREHINLKTPSVYEMIYDRERGCARILHSSRRKENDQDFRCRWIHIPANNEQWMADLFLSIGVRDVSMNDQRHDGLTVFNRYMIPQAKKYDFVKFRAPIPGLTATPTMHLPTVVEEPSKDGEQGQEMRIHASPTMSDERTPSQVAAAKITWADLPPIKGLGGNKAIVLFMPYLAYESHDGRKKVAKIINQEWKASTKAASMPPQSDRDSALIKGYMTSSTRPLHCRRTLDQYSYYMLETTERRDKDQVVYRWAKTRAKAKTETPILMVDQLWLWILPDGKPMINIDSSNVYGEANVYVPFRHNCHQPA